MPVFALYTFDDKGQSLKDSAAAEGAQTGSYQNGASAVAGAAVLDGKDDLIRIDADEAFDLDQGTLDITFQQGALPKTGDTATLLSRDSGGFRIEILPNGAIGVVHAVAGSQPVVFATGSGFVAPGDSVEISYSWDQGGEGGYLSISNTSKGTGYDTTVPATVTMDGGTEPSPWIIGADHSGATADSHFAGRIAQFSVSNTVDNNPDDDPSAVDDHAVTDAGVPVTVAIMANDTDGNGDELTIVGTPSSAQGKVKLNADGSITFTPNNGFSGEASVDYTVSDGNGGLDHGTLTIYVGVDSCRGRDGIIEGTECADLIDTSYRRDPDGDRVDAGDAVLPGAGRNDDVIVARGGNDTVRAGLGNDVVFGGTGNDLIYGQAGNDLLLGESGNDTIYGGDGNDVAYGGTGNDLIDTDCGDDKVWGGDGRDTIHAGEGADLVYGGGGDDRIYGGGGNDTLYGGAGNDTIMAGAGSDLVQGDAGNDLIYGGSGADENCDDDRGNDTLKGGAGNDTLYGLAGNDLLFGGSGNDLIFGGRGNDTLAGGRGADRLYGGADRDLFIEVSDGDFLDGGESGDDYDTLDLTGSGPLRIKYAADNPENGTIFFLDSVGKTVGSATFVNMENIIPCFTPGTLIATPRGEVPVEDLREGDKIVTRDSGIQQIRWAGARTLSWAQLNANPHLKPVLIKRGSLGNGLPERDMMVSPNHRMLVANDRTQLYFEEHEVLVAAKHLVSANGIQSIDSIGTTYLHFMFDRHEVVLANGAWTESFQPGDTTLKGMCNAQRAEIFEIFPDLRHPVGRDSYGAARRTLRRHEATLLGR